VDEAPRQAQLDGQQHALFLAIAEYDGELANWYLGACMAFATPTNPEHLVHAAHSIRELMNSLHTRSRGFLSRPTPAGSATSSRR
jgi:hypothetical protein